jgi:NDP-sugar pyrophosphorylase family protein
MSKRAVILAGGKGTRLRPYTITIPKPLVPVGEKPILEIIIKQLAKNSFDQITITVNHQAELIQAFFGDGSKWGVSIDYSIEHQPLSTMGPLKLINNLPENFLVMNGDILTDLNFSKLYEYHLNRNNIFTVASFQRTEKIDYGVLHLNEKLEIVGFDEKPEIVFDVSMGIYVVNSTVLKLIPENKFFGFDDLMKELVARNKFASVYRYRGYWLDIGRPDDYEKAANDIEDLSI